MIHSSMTSSDNSNPAWLNIISALRRNAPEIAFLYLEEQPTMAEQEWRDVFIWALISTMTVPQKLDFIQCMQKQSFDIQDAFQSKFPPIGTDFLHHLVSLGWRTEENAFQGAISTLDALQFPMNAHDDLSLFKFACSCESAPACEWLMDRLFEQGKAGSVDFQGLFQHNFEISDDAQWLALIEIFQAKDAQVKLMATLPPAQESAKSTKNKL